MARAKKPGTSKASIAASLPKLTIEAQLDEAKVKAIQRCIAKGSLKITISKMDLGAARGGESWLYD
jgi:anti-sigma28 factor (negative regulator of flagellin synthesis)